MFQTGNCRKFCVHMHRQSAIRVSPFLLWKHSVILRKFNGREQKLLSNVQIKHFRFCPYNCIWKLSVKGVLLPPTFITTSLHLLRQANTWQLTFSEIQRHKMFSANKKVTYGQKNTFFKKLNWFFSNSYYFSFSQKKIGRINVTRTNLAALKAPCMKCINMSLITLAFALVLQEMMLSYRQGVFSVATACNLLLWCHKISKIDFCIIFFLIYL